MLPVDKELLGFLWGQDAVEREGDLDALLIIAAARLRVCSARYRPDGAGDLESKLTCVDPLIDLDRELERELPLTGLELPGDAGVDAHAQDRGADRGYPGKQEFEPLVVIGVDSALAADLVVVDEIKDRHGVELNVAARSVRRRASGAVDRRRRTS